MVTEIIHKDTSWTLTLCLLDTPETIVTEWNTMYRTVDTKCAINSARITCFQHRADSGASIRMYTAVTVLEYKKKLFNSIVI